ncbi:MAG: hypothetical protein ACI9ES_002486 [Oceanospirillaceae bacterium]|jgi:hypothetical protein
MMYLVMQMPPIVLRKREKNKELLCIDDSVPRKDYRNKPLCELDKPFNMNER